MLSGCQTSAVDTVKTTSVTPTPRDTGAPDLDEGKAQFRAGNYGLAEQSFRKAVELDAGKRRSLARARGRL